MKVSIEVDNEQEAVTLLNGPYYKHLISDVDNHLRNEVKHNSKLTPDQINVLLETREYLFARASDLNLSID